MALYNQPKKRKGRGQKISDQYKLACYNALYQNFTDQSDFLEFKQEKIEDQLLVLDSATSDCKNAKNVMYEEKKKMNKVRELTFDDWLANNRQLSLFPSGESEEEITEEY